MIGIGIWVFILGFWAGVTGAMAAVAELTTPRLSKSQRIVERVVEFQRRAA